MQDTPTFHPTNGNSLSNEGKGSHLEEPRKFCICSNLLLLCLSTTGNLALEERRRQGEAEGGKGEGEEREKFTLSDSEQGCSQVTSGAVAVGKYKFYLPKFVTSNTF